MAFAVTVATVATVATVVTAVDVIADAAALVVATAIFIDVVLACR